MSNDPAKKTAFQERFAEQLTKKGMSQTKLAKEIGTPQQTLSDWSNGPSEPGPEDLRKMAKVFGCTVDYLVGLTSHPMPLPPSHWVIDLDAEKMIQRKEVPPDRGRWAWPVPDNHDVVPSTEYERRKGNLLGKGRKEEGGERG